tara:strand:- start:146 stop:862 length:717 start_codon:yes stop_codon:yes gene_type:complete
MKSLFSLLIKIRDRLRLKKIEDEYLNWLRFANAGMLDPGNVYAMKHVIKNLPTRDPIIEIGSFCGLSTNVLSYFLRKEKKENIFFCSDKWIFEGSENTTFLGLSDISSRDYKSFVKDTFIRNINFFSPNRPHPIELFSDEFFEKWENKSEVIDVFNQSIKLGGYISFCYIDGNHTYDFAKRDFENVNQYLVPGGFILFDDSSDSNPFGLTKLMKEIKQRSDYSLVMKNPNYLFQKNKI